MAGIHELPWELMDRVFDNIKDVKDLTSMARVRSELYEPATKRIWESVNADQRYRILMWACASGSTKAVHRLFDTCLTANIYIQLDGYPDHVLKYTPNLYLQLFQRRYKFSAWPGRYPHPSRTRPGLLLILVAATCCGALGPKPYCEHSSREGCMDRCTVPALLLVLPARGSR